VHPGSFYALPQSPQIFKQILMVAGFDRYFQVARCFRDEDLRADRQPEFTQLDMEMSFVEEQDVFAVWERVMADVWRETMGAELTIPFPRLRWEEAMERYGLDKPDVRFGLELRDIGEWARTSAFNVFERALEKQGRVMGLCVPAEHALSRKDQDGLERMAQTFGAKGLAWWKAGRDGGAGALKRFVTTPASAEALMERMQAREGDLCVFVADEERVAWRVLGELRSHFGKRFQLADATRFAFLWVTHFPMFERDAESGRWMAAHHPFTAPEDWDMAGAESDPGHLASRAYDLVLNGWELGSGSIRIHRADVQQRVFELLGIGHEEQQEKFSFLLEALGSGAPPHGGFALGLDRTVSLSLGLDNIRDVVAFPKTTSATDLMCQAPTPVGPEQLREVHIRTLE
jgi:aspartyl-tRNA synthetase